jgi:alpha-methylacyl-CoA racemase
MTGWGQDGPYAQAAGHDINYIALAGVLHSIGRKDSGPVPPLNLVGDFGGGGMLLAFGIACGLFETQRSGQGQVIDAAMVDGAAVLAAFIWGMRAMGVWQLERGTNLLDTGSHFYDAYECADGKHISIGSIEPQFYAELLEKSGLADEDLPAQMSRADWPAMKERVTALFKTKTRDQWCQIMEHTDICFAPVLDPDEAPQHPHNVARGTFVDVAGVTQPGPAPRFDRTPTEVPGPAAHAGQHTDELLAEAGYTSDDITKLRDTGAVK